MLFDPGKTVCARSVLRNDVAHAFGKTKALALEISRLNDTAFAVAVYASCAESPPSARKTRFWLLTKLFQTGLATCRITPKGFGFWFLPLSQAFPGAIQMLF